MNKIKNLLNTIKSPSQRIVALLITLIILAGMILNVVWVLFFSQRILDRITENDQPTPSEQIISANNTSQDTETQTTEQPTEKKNTNKPELNTELVQNQQNTELPLDCAKPNLESEPKSLTVSSSQTSANINDTVSIKLATTDELAIGIWALSFSDGKIIKSGCETTNSANIEITLSESLVVPILQGLNLPLPIRFSLVASSANNQHNYFGTTDINLNGNFEPEKTANDIQSMNLTDNIINASFLYPPNNASVIVQIIDKDCLSCAKFETKVKAQSQNFSFSINNMPKKGEISLQLVDDQKYADSNPFTYSYSLPQ